jgi:hypothetical protein
MQRTCGRLRHRITYPASTKKRGGGRAISEGSGELHMINEMERHLLRLPAIGGMSLKLKATSGAGGGRRLLGRHMAWDEVGVREDGIGGGWTLEAEM